MPQLKGGIKTYIEGDSTKYCTTGWLGRRTDTNAMVILTAGHCLGHGDGVDDDWWHWDYEIGGELKSTFASGAVADVGLLQKVSGVTVTAGDSVLADPALGLSGIKTVDYFSSSSSQHEGDPVCRIGANPGSIKTCGSIVLEDESKPSVFKTTQYTIHHTWVVSFDSRSGDSGRPIFRPSPNAGQVIGYGTHVHSDPDTQTSPPPKGWYSPWNWGRLAYDNISSYTFNLCLSPSC